MSLRWKLGARFHLHFCLPKCLVHPKCLINVWGFSLTQSGEAKVRLESMCWGRACNERRGLDLGFEGGAAQNNKMVGA